ncbi:SOH1 family protein [Phellopilus nigrolimitatus]|nr:SOH1 family protein [Phellopilus nigrolimitatus]
MLETPAPLSLEAEVRAANRARFELELEFVQALANPFYLHSLAQQNILSQPAFVNFLEYLLYWKGKDYARFIHYPHALHHLDLLQNAQFRSEIGKDEWREYLNQKQFDHWRTWREGPNRLTGAAASLAAAASAATEFQKMESNEGGP